jgi:hypothetical protein
VVVLLTFLAVLLPPVTERPVWGQSLLGPNAAAAKTGKNSLLSLPPMRRVIPIQRATGPRSATPEALAAPHYCDAETLRLSATIRAIRFWDRDRGIAVGDLGSLRVTLDGGESWETAACPIDCRWNDAIWLDSRHIVVVGGGRDAITGISRGAIRVSSDAGRTWRDGQATEMPRLLRIDRKRERTDGGIEIADTGGRTVLVAHGESDPVSGATKFESFDGGRTWQAVLDSSGDVRPQFGEADRRITADRARRWSEATTVNATIRTSCRIDDQTLFAAGDHGVIVRSKDQGTSWQVLEKEDASTSILFIASSIQRIPWALIGRETLENRLRTNVLVTRQSSGPISEPELDQLALADQAAMNLGVAAVDVCRASVANDSVDELNESTTPADTFAELQTWIDLHRPPVLVLDASFPDSIKRRLFQYAAAHGAKRVIEYSDDQRGEMMLHFAALLPKSGVLAGDFEADARLQCEGPFRLADLLVGRRSDGHQAYALDIRYNAAGKQARGSSVADSIQLSASQRLPARETRAHGRRLQVLQGRLKQRNKMVDALLQTTDRARFAKGIRSLLDQTSRDDQFRTAWQFVPITTPRQRSVLWQELSRRFPEHSSARLAELQRQAFESSLERNEHQIELNPSLIGSAGGAFANPHQTPVGQRREGFGELSDSTEGILRPESERHAAFVSPFQVPTAEHASAGAEIMQASATMPIAPQRQAARSTDGGGSPEVDLAWQMHPVRLMVTAAVERNAQGTAIDPETIANTSSTSESASSVEPTGEQLSADLRRVAERRTVWSDLLRKSSSQMTTAVRTSAPPRLDGVLEEAFWRSSTPAKTRRDPSLEIRAAYDDRFVYFAMIAPRAGFAHSADPQQIGQRDAELFDADRVELSLDIDRDLLTAFDLQFTPDGHTHDSLCGDVRWAPTWYVASASNGDRVVTEIAIEQASLTGRVKSGDQWFLKAEVIRALTPAASDFMPSPYSRLRVDFQ